MNKNINDLIFVIVLQAIIMKNAQENGWHVRCEGKKIIMIKKLSQMTYSDDDVNNVIKKILHMNPMTI